MNMNCEQVRDMYPELMSGALDSERAVAVRAHIAACDGCQTEAALLGAMRRSSAEVPDGLHERIVRAATQPRRASLRFSAGKLALAATFAAAAIGGSILLQPTTPASAPDVRSTDHGHYGLGFVTVEDALLSGATSLDDLTIEQLEALLGELES